MMAKAHSTRRWAAPLLLALFALFVSTGAIGCGKKTQTTTTTTAGEGPAGAPTMMEMGGPNKGEYDVVKACCDALMNGIPTADPEQGTDYRRAGAVCTEKAGEVLMGRGSRAEALSAVAQLMSPERLPAACR